MQCSAKAQTKRIYNGRVMRGDEKGPAIREENILLQGYFYKFQRVKGYTIEYRFNEH